MKQIIKILLRILPILLALLIVTRISSIFATYINDFDTIREDTWRDYLVGRHLAFSEEKIARGPPSNFTNTRLSSPIYFYLCSYLVRLWDDIRIFFVANILILSYSLFLLFLILKNKFGYFGSLVSIFSLVESRFFLDIASAYWGSYLNLPLIFFGLLLGTKKEANQYFHIVATLSLTTAGIIYNAGYLYLGLYFLFLLIKKEKSILRCLLASALLLTICYYPVMLDFLKSESEFVAFNSGSLNDTGGFLRYLTAFNFLIITISVGILTRSNLTALGKILIIPIFILLISKGAFLDYNFISQGKIWDISENIVLNSEATSFQMLVLKDNKRNTLIEAGLWAQIEKHTGRKFTRIDNFSTESFSEIVQNPDKVFLVCLNVQCPKISSNQKNIASDKTYKVDGYNTQNY